MNEPWFDPMKWSWVPGTALGVVGGLLGAVGGTLAPLGRAKPVVIGLWLLMIALAVFLFMAGLVAYFAGQPYGVWYGLGLPGLAGSIVLGVLLPIMLTRYREAEERKVTAKDLS